MACAIALAAGTGLTLSTAGVATLASPTSASATSGLQIAVDPPGAASDSSMIMLDVNFKGGNVHQIELYVDGSLIKRQAIRTHEGHGVISFALDESLLSEGKHDVLIKAFDASGSSASATTRLMVASVDPNALARFIGLKSRSEVQGVVPIEIKVDSSIRSPYVTYLIDNSFKAFINYPPFTYNWDSAHIGNGPHTIGIEVYDGESLAKVQTLTLEVNVNNPGGFTNRVESTPDLGHQNAGNTNPVAAAVEAVMREQAESAAPNAAVAPIQSGVAGLLRSALPMPYSVQLRDRQPVTGRALMVHAMSALSTPVLGSQSGAVQLIAPHMASAHLTPLAGAVDAAMRAVRPGETLGSASLLGAVVLRSARNSASGTAQIGNPGETLSVGAPNLISTHDSSMGAAGPLKSAAPRLMSVLTTPVTVPNRSGAPVHSDKGTVAIGNPIMTHTTTAPNAAAVSEASAPGLLGILSAPSEIDTSRALPGAGLARAVAKPRRPGNVAVQPSSSMRVAAATSSATISAPSTIASAAVPVSRVASHTAASSRHRGDLVNIQVKSFDVAFDNTKIAFDVPPRVQHGMPLAPFRQIFEHTGGVVRWYGRSHTVRAVNSTHEIQFRVGHKVAQVNNRPMVMDAKPYVDRGRAIVPLSFVRDAMDVKVNFDSQTGRLLIESNK